MNRFNYTYLKTYSGLRGNSDFNFRNNEILAVRNDGKLHSTTTEKSTLQHDEELADYVFQVYDHFKLNEPVFSRCLPVYRDAIVFFDDKHNIVRIIHICFECANIKDENDNNYFIAMNGYYYLKDFLVKLGHPID